MPRAILALAFTAALAACGALENPDLDTGTLSGRIVNATGSAYLYPLGSPGLVVRPAADGRYTIEEVPVETVSLVVVDGAPGSWRASLVPVTVEGASQRVAPDVDAAGMPPAGRVGAVARLGGGVASAVTSFTAVGTDRIDVAPATPGGVAILEPLPAGTFELHAVTGGFTGGHLPVAVLSGATTPIDVPLEVEAGDPEPGCTQAGATCRTGLFCDDSDGICYECLSDADCATSATGETVCEEHACRAPSASQREICHSCTADAECGAGACASAGFCTRACTVDTDCPAGFACSPDGARSVCRPPKGCSELKEAFGAECFDASCVDHLAGCVCLGAQPLADPPVPGYCTAPCDPARADDCALVPGYACDALLKVCVTSP